MSVNDKMTAIADAIRGITGGTELLTLDDMAEAVNDVYNAGKKAEYDAFWDAYQENGSRTDYKHAFSHHGWTQDNLKPKYQIQPTDASYMFYWLNWSYDDASYVDLRAEVIGVEIDFSKSTSFNYCFQNAKITHLGVMDLTSCTNVNTTFCNMYWLNSIEKIIVNENNVFNDACFQYCYAGSVTFEGVLASNLKLSYMPLNKASIESVIGVLSTTATEKTLTLSLSNVNTLFETSEGAADGSTSEEWLNLVATKSNWTITLV